MQISGYTGPDFEYSLTLTWPPVPEINTKLINCVLVIIY